MEKQQKGKVEGMAEKEAQAWESFVSAAPGKACWTFLSWLKMLRTASSTLFDSYSLYKFLLSNFLLKKKYCEEITLSQV